MKEIKLTKGKVAIVDDEDYELLMEYSWYAHSQGYAVRDERVSHKKKKGILMHREIMKCPKGLEVDHIDGNRLNNQRSNLRVVTSSQNKFNKTRLRGDNTSGYHGVSWDRFRNKWKAQIQLDGKNMFIGRFETKEEAAEAYNIKAMELFGEYAYLNKIDREGGDVPLV